MSTILEEILEVKREEINQFNKEFMPSTREKSSFLRRLQARESLAVIAEFKRASPSKGMINEGADPVVQARKYIENGADAISVLTDEQFFKGSMKDLEMVKKISNIPILCKDFLIDEQQIIRAENAGADIVLLIAAAMDEKRLNELYNFAVNIGLDVLVEVHNEAEAQAAVRIGAKIVGINNRDLKTFTVDLEITERLAPMLKNAGAFVISESGISSRDDVRRVTAAGASGILVGEAFMKAGDAGSLLRDMKIGDGAAR